MPRLFTYRKLTYSWGEGLALPWQRWLFIIGNSTSRIYSGLHRNFFIVASTWYIEAWTPFTRRSSVITSNVGIPQVFRFLARLRRETRKTCFIGYEDPGSRDPISILSVPASGGANSMGRTPFFLSNWIQFDARRRRFLNLCTDV